MSLGVTAPVGIGWRHPHYEALLAQRPALDFLEVHSENFFGQGGAPLEVLRLGRRAYPISLHGVGLSLGSAAGLDADHLERLAQLVERTDPVRVSDHACFARAAWGGDVAHAADLLPIAFTQASLDIMVRHVQQVQERLKRPLLVENISAYLGWADQDMDEPSFFNALTQRSGCGMLLDVNNLVVNALNAGQAPLRWACDYVSAVTPPHSVGEIHLAGFSEQSGLVIDDHSRRVSAVVWQVYAHAIAHCGAVPSLVEWDTQLPDLAVLLGEAERAREVSRSARQQVLGAKAVAR